MTFLALVVALFLEQAFPLYERRPFGWRYFLRWTAFLKIKMNTGSIAEGWIAVMCALLPILIIAWTIYYVANAIHPLLGWLWDVLIVYACMGFRQFSRYYTQIAKKLQEGNDDIARTELALWLGRSLDVVSPSQIVALTIAKGSWSGLRHVFGVLIWFVLLPGPLGALLYQLTHLMVDAWSQTPSTQFDKAAHRVRYVLDWVAIRLTAVTFAIAGNFEDTLHAWRTCPVTNSHRHANQRALYLAATGGAIGVKIPAELADGEIIEVGGEASPDQRDLQSLVGLVWRALVLMLVVVLFTTVVAKLG